MIFSWPSNPERSLLNNASQIAARLPEAGMDTAPSVRDNTTPTINTPHSNTAAGVAGNRFIMTLP